MKLGSSPVELRSYHILLKSAYWLIVEKRNMQTVWYFVFLLFVLKNEKEVKYGS